VFPNRIIGVLVLSTAALTAGAPHMEPLKTNTAATLVLAGIAITDARAADDAQQNHQHHLPPSRPDRTVAAKTLHHQRVRQVSTLG
jgi:hypothetical protein